MINNKGAMFGLDARIALAIFGALSVISGAALYSAIQQAKVTSKVTILSEVDKAIVARYLDVGDQMVDFNSTTKNLNALFLDESETGWKGPYLSNYTALYGGAMAEGFFNDKAGLLIKKASIQNWNDYTETDGACTSIDCSIWIEMRYANLTDVSVTLLKEIDILVDGSDSSDSGNIRYGTGTSGNYYNLFYRSMSLVQ